MLELGRHIEDYTVDALLGRGTAAAIYRLRGVDGTFAALKVAHTTDEIIVRRIMAEGDVLQRIHHPNVVRVDRVLVVDGRPALLMELIEGPTLASWLDAYELPTMDEGLDIFKGICRGVQVAHDYGLVHRDLNPNNILLAIEAHKKVLPKLVDFGLVRAVVRPSPSRTGSGPLGTVSYMAPEQMHEGREADQRSDLYALGCILYEITTGGRAFRGNLSTVRRKSKHGDFTAPLEARPDMPARVGDVIMKLLQVLPADRFQTVEELMAALYDEAPPAYRPGKLDSLVFRQWSVSHVSTQAAAVVRTLVPSRDGPDELADATDRAHRRRRNELLGLAVAAVVLLVMAGLTIALLVHWTL